MLLTVMSAYGSVNYNVEQKQFVKKKITNTCTHAYEQE